MGVPQELVASKSNTEFDWITDAELQDTGVTP